MNPAVAVLRTARIRGSIVLTVLTAACVCSGWLLCSPIPRLAGAEEHADGQAAAGTSATSVRREGTVQQDSAPSSDIATKNESTVRCDSTEVLVARYFHRTFRCETCILMEQYVEDVISADFPEAHALGQLAFRTYDFEDPVNADLAEAYGLGDGPALILSKLCDGRELAHKALPSIWDLLDDPLWLSDMLREEIAAALDTLGRGARGSYAGKPR